MPVRPLNHSKGHQNEDNHSKGNLGGRNVSHGSNGVPSHILNQASHAHGSRQPMSFTDPPPEVMSALDALNGRENVTLKEAQKVFDDAAAACKGGYSKRIVALVRKLLGFLAKVVLGVLAIKYINIVLLCLICTFIMVACTRAYTKSGPRDGLMACGVKIPLGKGGFLSRLRTDLNESMEDVLGCFSPWQTSVLKECVMMAGKCVQISAPPSTVRLMGQAFQELLQDAGLE